MAGYEGLAVSIYGEYYRYNDSQEQVQYVENNGVDNRTFTSVGADNLLAITVTDTSTVTSGYLQPFYTSITLTSDASWSTGNAQINAFATDITLDGTVACEVEGLYVYITSASTPTAISSGNINGINIYMDDLKGSANVKACVQLHMADGNAATGADAFIYCRVEGASGAANAFVEFGATALPAYFIDTGLLAGGSKMVRDATTDGTQDKVLAVLINGSTYYIALYQAS